jgi:hypothetical protein
MRCENFEVKDNIYLRHGGFDLDLHNNYDFVGFTYSVTDRLVEMRWSRGTGEWVDLRAPAKLRLQLRGVSHMSAAPRDLQMPFTEDDCLSDIAFVESAQTNDELFTTEKRDPSWHWVFLFQSAFAIRIGGESAYLSTEQA